MTKKGTGLIIVFILAGIIISACTTSQIQEDNQLPGYTSTITSSPTNTITPTPTPIPVSLKQAVEEGNFGIIKEFNKGVIEESLFSPDGTQFAAVATSGLYIYDVNTWEEIIVIPANEDSHISTIKYSKDGKKFAYGEYHGERGEFGGEITICDADTFKDCKTIKAFKEIVYDLAISPDGQNIVSTGSENGSYLLRLWNLIDGSAIAARQLDFWGMVNYSQDGTSIMADNRIWSSKDLQFINKMEEVNGNVLFSPFSDVVAGVAEDLTIYNVETDKVTTFEKPFKDVGWAHDISFVDFMDGSHLLVREANYNLLHYIDINTGVITDFSAEEISNLNIKNPNIYKITKENEIIDLGFYPFSYGSEMNLSKNGKYLLTENGVFNTESWSIVPQESEYKTDWSKTFNLLNGDIARIDMSGGSIDNYKFTISIFSEEDLTLKSTKSVDYTLDEWYDQVALSPDGKLLAVGVRYGSLSLFDVEKNELIVVKQNAEAYYHGFGPPDTFSRIQFDDSSKVLRTTSFDGKLIKYWNVPTLERIDEANRDENPFITDNTYRKIVWTDGLIAARDLETLKIWTADKSLLAEYPLINGDVIEVNLDGTLLYTCSADGVFSIWGYKP